MTVGDQWFAALDGCVVHVGAMIYSLVVIGIHCQGADDIWIQLAPFDDEDRGVVLHCIGPVTPGDAIRELRSHLGSRARNGSVLSVSAYAPLAPEL